MLSKDVVKINHQIENDSLYYSNCNSSNGSYQYDKKNMPEACKNKVDQMYQSAFLYLDKDFKKQFPKAYNNRYCELVVANQILDSQYVCNLVPKSKQEIKRNLRSIDFKIVLPNLSPYEIVIECTCPDFGVNIINDNEDFIYKEDFIYSEQNSDLIVRSYTESGENWHIMSRFTSCIKDKIAHFQDCVEQGTIADKSYKILFVSGATLLREENKRREPKLYSLRYQFINAVEGIPSFGFSYDGSNSGWKHDHYSIKKKEETFVHYKEFKEHLKYLDGIIYFEGTPHNVNSFPFHYPFYHCFVKKDISEIIKNIFPIYNEFEALE